MLCLDDDLVIARMVGDVVRFCGHEPIVEQDSVQALVKYLRADLGAVIADYMMPTIDGLELLASFEESSPNTRRVLLTAAPNEKSVLEAVQSGVVQMLIAKPPSINDIRTALAWM